MKYYDLLETVVLHDQVWYKIKGDDAFPYVLDDWYNGYRDAYFEHLTRHNVVVQAGGFCGIYPKLFSQTFETVYTFEPDPLNFFCLTMNCQADNIIKNQAALGAEHEMISVNNICPTNKGMHRVQHTISSRTPSYRIDDLNLTDCNLIQLDTEGYEYEILWGALKTIEKFSPVISVEDTNSNIEKLLEKYGYLKRITINRDTVFSK